LRGRIALPDGPQDERFKVVVVSGDEVQNGRTSSAITDTPELVYRRHGQRHPNGVTYIVEFVIASRADGADRSRFQMMFGPDL